MVYFLKGACAATGANPAGYNCCLCGYGQTGTGKTYTLHGDWGDANQRGLMPRVAAGILSRAQALRDGGAEVRVVSSASRWEVEPQQSGDGCTESCGSQRAKLVRARCAGGPGLFSELLTWRKYTYVLCAHAVMQPSVSASRPSLTQLQVDIIERSRQK